MSALDEQVALELRNRRYHRHRHLAGGASEVHASKGQAMDANALGSEVLNGCADVHRVTPKAVKFGYDQDVAFFEALYQFAETFSFHRRG